MSIGSRAVQDKLKTELSKPKQIKLSKDPDLATDEKKAQAANPSLYPFKNIENGELFVDDVKATDVVQGSLGDCYLVAALAAVAHHRSRFHQAGNSRQWRRHIYCSYL
jgi:hypothetical protein